jgi:hypothetical protein
MKRFIFLYETILSNCHQVDVNIEPFFLPLNMFQQLIQ